MCQPRIRANLLPSVFTAIFSGTTVEILVDVDVLWKICSERGRFTRFAPTSGGLWGEFFVSQASLCGNVMVSYGGVMVFYGVVMVFYGGVMAL
jgi:hypothetical protein